MLEVLFTYSCNQTQKMSNKCKKENNYNIIKLIKDQRGGKTTIGPAHIQVIYNHFRPNK